MSPVQRKEQAQQVSFSTMVANLQEISKPSSRLVMNDQLQVTNRRGCKWLLLCLLRPFYSLFCKDIYSHYRIDKVATALLKACESNKELLKSDPKLLQTVTSWITNLETKTKSKDPKIKGKHDTCLKTFRTGLSKLNASPQPEAKPLARPPQPVRMSITARPTAHGRKPSVPSPQLQPVKFTIPLQNRPEAEQKDDVTKSTIFMRPETSDLAQRFTVDAFEKQWDSLLSDLNKCTPPEKEKKEVPWEVQIKELKKALDRFLPRCFGPSPLKLSFVKTNNARTLQLLKPNGEIVEKIKIPISLEVVYQDGRLQDVIILTKHRLGKGGETRVRSCLSLFNGTILGRKKCSGSFQRELIEHFLQNPCPEISPVIAIRDVEKGKSKKVQSLELFSQANLKEFIRKKDKPSFVNLLPAAMDILYAVEVVHTMEITDYTLNGTAIRPFNLFHSDLTPSNFLFDKGVGSKPVAGVLTDWGCAHPLNVGGTPGYQAPQQIELRRKYKQMSPEKIVEHNLEFGQSSDIWSMGLVLCALFGWRVDEGGGPPLACIEDSLLKMQSIKDTFDNAKKKKDWTPVDSLIEKLKLEGFDKDILKLIEDSPRNAEETEDSIPVDSLIEKLEQEKITEDIYKLRDECKANESSDEVKNAMDRVWGLIARMVQKEPKGRPGIEEVITAFLEGNT